MTIESGQVILVPHPFSRDVWTAYEQDDGEFIPTDVPTWRPGTRVENRHSPVWTGEDVPDPTDVADGMGTQILTVVSVHHPGGKYRAKVFYTRQWRDPDGKTFGKRTAAHEGNSRVHDDCAWLPCGIRARH